MATLDEVPQLRGRLHMRHDAEGNVLTLKICTDFKAMARFCPMYPHWD